MAKNHKNVCKNNGQYPYALMPDEQKSVKSKEILCIYTGVDFENLCLYD